MRLFFLLCVTALMATAKPYNLLVIQTDEHLFKTLGCYGGKVVLTPNIDWIAQHGAIATSFYATTPVCSPSRAAFMSGLYPHKTPVSTNNIPLDNGIVTFAEVLRRHGYATGYAGKWHLDGEGNRNGGRLGSSDGRTTVLCLIAVTGKNLLIPRMDRKLVPVKTVNRTMLLMMRMRRPLPPIG